MTDIYQERYLVHQERKKQKIKNNSDGKEGKKWSIDNKIIRNSFEKLSSSRSSQRIFNKQSFSVEFISMLVNNLPNTPSSCNRQAVKVKLIVSKEDMFLLQEMLVGGAGWIGNAKMTVLLLADMLAYKSPNEVDFMPFLDAGFMGMNICYIAEACGVGSCFVNPNIREETKQKFANNFIPDGHKFCGAVALGMYDKKATKINKDSNIFL